MSGCVGIPNTYYSTTDDYVVGLRWFDRGMEQGKEEFYQKAAQYWEPLVEKQDCDAEYRLGLLYFMGKGKPQSFDKAFQLWEKAANTNQQRAQWALGDLYYQNHENVLHHCNKTPNCNIKKDLTEALFWYELFKKSAKYDNELKYVNNIIPKVKLEMTDGEINEIEIKVSQWKPTPKDCKPRNLL